MSDDAAAIITQNSKPQAQPNPLTMFKGWQDYANSIATNAQIKATTANTEQSTVGSKQEQSMKALSDAYQQIGAAISLPDEQRGAAMYKILDTGLAAGKMSPEQYASLKSEMPPPGASPSAFTMYGLQHLRSLQTAQAQLESMAPKYGTVNTGSGVQFTAQPGLYQSIANPSSSPQVVGQEVPVNMSRSQLAEPREVIDNDPSSKTFGQKITKNQGQILHEQNSTLGGPANETPGSTPLSGAPQTNPLAIPQQRPMPLPNNVTNISPRPQAPLATPTNPAGDKGVPTALPPGTAESIKATKESNAAAATALTDTDATRPQKLALLDDILTQANTPGAFSGPDAPAWAQIKARLQQIPGIVDDNVKNSTTAQESMEKAIANFQTMQMKNMIGTNAGLAQTIAGSPHMELSKGGMQANIHQIEGTLDAERAQSEAWQNSGQQPEDYKKWQKDFFGTHTDENGNKVQFDPRAFWISRMSPSERAQFVKGTTDKKQLENNYNYAHKQGWFN